MNEPTSIKTRVWRSRDCRIASRVFIALAIALASWRVAHAEEPLLERDVLPILTKQCMGCHGGLKQESKLDLRTVPAMLKGGESGPALVSGNVDGSEMWKRIAADEMPEGDNKKLSAKEKDLIRRWIAAGMPTVAALQRKQADPLLPAGKKHEPRQVAAAIDKHIDRALASVKLKPAQRSGDAEFLRRVYLDLTGRVPTGQQAAAFLDSTEADKRAKLIDALLATPQFGEQFGRTWRDWICPPELPSDMNAGTQPHGQARALGKWLGEKFAADQPWDKIARDILTVKGEIKSNPQVIFFGLVGQDGKTTADGSARAAASLFMGVQLQCARCHDDPYRAWSQREHWALAAFFGRSQGDFKKIEGGKGPNKKPGEIAIPASAFKNKGKIVRAAFLNGQKFQAKNNDDLRGPFVDWLTAKENPYFARSFANRLWFYLFARGIVNPIDDFRELNPPSHPGLINLLAGEFSASGYRIKHLFRCVCNSQAYQRTSGINPGTDAEARTALTTAFGRMPLRVMTADMLYDSLKGAYGDAKLDLRTSVKHSTVGMAAPVGDAYLEFHRRFGANEEDVTDFTHGVAQMLTMINHPRLLGGSKALDEYLKKSPAPSKQHEQLVAKLRGRIKWLNAKPPKDAPTPAKQVQSIEWLYLSTLSRRPTEEEATEAMQYVGKVPDRKASLRGVLWMLVNRSEFILVR